MAFFKGRRKSDEEFKIALEREALEQKAGRSDLEDKSFVLPFARFDGAENGTDNRPAHKSYATNVLTPEELLGFNPKIAKNEPFERPVRPADEIKMSKSDAPTPSSGQFLFQRMLDARRQAEEQSLASNEREQQIEQPKLVATIHNTEQTSEPITSPAPKVEPIQQPSIQAVTFEPKTETAPKPAEDFVIEEIKLKSIPTTQQQKDIVEPLRSDSTLEKEPIGNIEEQNKIVFSPSSFGIAELSEQKESLLAKCDAYMCDEDGNKYTSEKKESYSLESVDSILKSFEERAIERANRRYANIDGSQIPLASKISQTKKQILKTEPVSSESTVPSIKPFSVLKATESAFSASESLLSAPVVKPKVPLQKPQIPSVPIRSELKEVPISEHKVYTGAEPKIMVETVTAQPPVPVLNFQYSYADKTVDDTKTSQPNTPPSPALMLLDKELKSAINVAPEKTMQFDLPDITDLPATEKLERDAKFKLFNTDEEENDPDDELSFESTPSELEELDDYTCIDDAESVKESLNKSRRKLRVRFTLTLFVAIISALLASPLAESLKSFSIQGYLLTSAALVFLAMLFNLNIIGSIASIFKNEPDMDLPAAVATIFSLIYSILIAFIGTPEKAVPIGLVAILSLLFGSVGKLSMINRIRNNFRQIASTEPKRAVQFIDDQKSIDLITKGTSLGETRICAGRKTVNITNFLRNSYCRDPLESRVRLLTGLGLLTAFILGIAVLILNGSIISALLAFTAAVCITAAPSTLLISNLPLKLAANRLNCYGAMLSGYCGADEIDSCNATIMDIGDLFPDGSVKLVDMRLLSPNPIDQSLLAAAALTAGARSPLAGVFKQITDTTATKIPSVDSINYEENMGISGWVENRRVFVGNRTLLQTHGFNLPPVEVDKKILRKGFFPVYLASDGVPCALLIVKYTADDEISYELRRLCNTGTTVFVNSCDPNTGAEMICDYFGLYKDSVAMIGSSGVSKYKEVMNFKESTSAFASYGNSVCGLASIITAGVGVKKLTTVMTALYIISVIVGIAATTVLSLSGRIELITPLSLTVYQLVTLLITCLPAYIKRP